MVLMRFILWLKIAICWIYWIIPAHSARILGIFTFPGMSHFNYNMAIMENLLSAGHQVTVISPYIPKHSHPNLTVISSVSKNQKPLEPYTGQLFWIFGFLQTLSEVEEVCYHVMSEEQMKVLKNFDVMFVETFHMYQCYFPLAKMLDIAIIATFSSRSHIEGDFSIGNPRMLSTFLAEDVFISTSEMTLFQKLYNIFRELEFRVVVPLKEWKLKMFYEKQFPGQNARDFVVSMLFVNDHTSLSSRPTTSNTINIGGLYIKSIALNPLPEKLKIFIEEASRGVILFALGTVFSTEKLDIRIKNTLTSAFSKIPQKVIWVFDGEIKNISENVLLSKWVPQKEILAHENVIAFISHCGIGSTYEAIYFGKPMVMVPLFGEQPKNAKDLNTLEVGVYVDILELSEQNLLDAINEVVNNTKYRQNMEKLSRKFKDDPVSPSELVVYWTEYVIKNKGANYLRSVDADMPLYQYFLLDITISVIVIVTLCGLFMFLILKYFVFLTSKWFW